MAGIERDRDRDVFAAGRLANTRRAQVILHVALAFERRRVDRVAVEFRKELLHALADNIDQSGEASAVRHSDDAFGDVSSRAALEQFVDHGDHRFAAFERKSLVAFEALVEE